MKTGKNKSFFPGEKSKVKKGQLFPTIFLMKIMKKSPVMKLKSYFPGNKVAYVLKFGKCGKRQFLIKFEFTHHL